jgi:hypothetical protein
MSLGVGAPYFELYAKTVFASNLCDLGVGVYNSKYHNDSKAFKIGWAVIKTVENLSFFMPVAGWCLNQCVPVIKEQAISLDLKVMLTASVALPCAFLGYIVAGFGANPLRALGRPRAPKDLTGPLDPFISDVFRALNITAVTIGACNGNISVPVALLTNSTCLLSILMQQVLQKT